VAEYLPSQWRAGWRSRRDRWLTSPAFQRWALRWPLLRTIARRRAEALFDLCAGFTYSQTLRAVVEVGLCESVAAGPREIAELARQAGMPVEAMRRLSAAAVSLGLLEHRGPESIGIGALGAALVGNPMIGALVAHHDLLYEDLADPVSRLRSRSAATRLGQYWAYAGRPAEAGSRAATEPYSALMSASQAMIAEEIIAAYPVARHRRWLDIGGGNAELLIRLARVNAGLRGTCFDLPGVSEQARSNIAAAGLGDRLCAHGGDLFCDPLPEGHDIASLVRILHDHEDAAVRRILAAAHAALAPGGSILVAEPMSDPAGGNRVADAYFGMYLLAMGQGRARSPDELTTLLREAGFRSIRRRRTRFPMLLRVLVARR
jgi:demethylspheroidene O-methyltransferase